MSSPTPDVVYHYTSVEVFKLIIDGLSLRFSHIKPQNDIKEVTHFQDIVNAFAKKIATASSRGSNSSKFQFLDQPILFECGATEGKRDQISGAYKAYTVSFCEDGDCKSQWNEYANHFQGVSIGFRPGYFHQCGFERLDSDLGNDVGLIECISYAEPEEIENDLLSKLAKDPVLWFKGVFVHQHFHKSWNWHEEREWRLYFCPIEGEMGTEQKRTILSNVNWKDSQDTKYSGKQRLPFLELDPKGSPIYEVVLGSHCKLSKKDVRNILTSSGFGDSIEIRKSGLQIRQDQE